LETRSESESESKRRMGAVMVFMMKTLVLVVIGDQRDG
jgi:hypothetical protein